MPMGIRDRSLFTDVVDALPPIAALLIAGQHAFATLLAEYSPATSKELQTIILTRIVTGRNLDAGRVPYRAMQYLRLVWRQRPSR